MRALSVAGKVYRWKPVRAVAVSSALTFGSSKKTL